MRSTYIRWFFVSVVAVIGLAAYGAFLSVPKRTLHNHVSAPDRRRPINSRNSPVPSTPAPLRPQLAGYRVAIRQNLFTAPEPPARPSSLHSPKSTHSTPAPIVPSVPPIDPLADAVYAGSITVDGTTTALIESRSTKQGVYVGSGGAWQSFQVVAVTPQQITFSVNGRVRNLPVSDTVNLVPLAANAPGSAPNGGAAAGQVSGGGAPLGEATMAQAVTFVNDNVATQIMMQDMRAKEMEMPASQEVLSIQKE